MPSLDDLKKELKVLNLHKITKAMKTVAAAKLRKAQENAEQGVLTAKRCKYNFNLTKNINDPENAPKLLVGTGKDKTYLCVVLTADRGLCEVLTQIFVNLQKLILKDSDQGKPENYYSWL